MKILQVDIVGTEKGVCASMGAPRSLKGGEEQTREKGHRRRRAVCQWGMQGEGPHENGVACECPSRANSVKVQLCELQKLQLDQTRTGCNWTGLELVATGPAVPVLQLLEVVWFQFIRIQCVGEPPQDQLGPVSTGLWSLLTPPQCTANHDRRPP